MIVLVELLYGEALRVVLGLKPPIHSREGVFTNENLSLCESLVLQRGLRGSSNYPISQAIYPDFSSPSF